MNQDARSWRRHNCGRAAVRAARAGAGAGALTSSVMSAPWQKRRPDANILYSQSDSLRKTLPGSAPMPCSANCSPIRPLHVEYLARRVRRDAARIHAAHGQRKLESTSSRGCEPGVEDAGVGGAAPEVDEHVEDEAGHCEDFILVSLERERRCRCGHCKGRGARGADER